MLPFVIIKSGILSVLLESPEGSSSSKVITLTSWALERLADQLGLRPPEALNLENLSKNAQVTGLVTAELPVKAASESSRHLRALCMNVGFLHALLNQAELHRLQKGCKRACSMQAEVGGIAR